MNFKKIMMMGLLIANVSGQDFVDVEIGEVHQPCQQVVETVESGQQTTDEDVALNGDETHMGDHKINLDWCLMLYERLERNIEIICLSVISGLIVGVIMNEINQ